MAEKRNCQKSEKITAGICVGVLFAFLLSIFVVIFARQVLVKRMGVENAFTRFVFAGNEGMGNIGVEESAEENVIEIDWTALYPFPESTGNSTAQAKTTTLYRYLDRIADTKRDVENYCTEHLFRRKRLVELERNLEQVIDWKFVSYAEYNDVTFLPDGYLTGFVARVSVLQKTDSILALNNFCESEGVHFLYVQAPFKVSAYEDLQISGVLDFSNQNTDELLQLLQDNDVDYIDLREVAHEEGLMRKDLFYRTDHHWLTTAGLWAAQRTLEFCNDHYGFHAETSRLELEQFEQILYPEWFLGSQGKKVTLARTTPDDFVLLYPRGETEFHYEIPNLDINITGDYSIFYDMNQIEEKDYYEKNPYGGCIYGDRPLEHLENLNQCDDKKILIIHDSFGDCYVPCLALCEKEIDSLDVRHYTGSVRTYIKETKPDLVMVLYHAGSTGGDIDWSTHEDEFDFR